MQDAKKSPKIAIWAPSHNFVGLYLRNYDMSSTCFYNMVNFGPLTAKIHPVVWGTPANFNGFRLGS